MNRFLSFALIALVLSTGCSTTGSLGSMTSAQALAIGQPIVSAGLALILRNNPSDIPLATKIGADLTGGNFNDLTLTGINAAIAAICAKEKASPDLTAIVEGAFDSGLAGYLEAVGESALAKDPNAQAVLQALGSAITSGAAIATASPK